MRIVRLLLVFAVLAPLASVARAADDWKGLHRRLHLPPASGTCPTSPTTQLGQGTFSQAAPVYLQNVGSAPVPGTIDISLSQVDDKGWRGQKTHSGAAGPLPAARLRDALPSTRVLRLPDRRCELQLRDRRARPRLSS